MTFRDFLDASYALIAEEHLRIQPLQDLAAVAEMISPKDVKMEKVPSKREVTKRNEDAMAALKARMAGVTGLKKPRRAHV